MARPSEFTQQLADEICERLADGESLRTMCEGEDFPARSTIFKWLSDFQSFSDQYAHARVAQADALADDVIAIADTQQRGEKRTTKADGSVETVEADMIEHRRLQIDARKWKAAKLAPKKYGERTTLEHTDPDGKNPFASLMETVAANGRPGPKAGG